MSPEEYERIKEAEKERLRAARTLQSMQQALRRQQALRAAVEGLTGAQQALDENEALTDRIAFETARSEARLDLALEAGRASAETPEEAEAPPVNLDLDDEQTAEQARATVRQFKQALGLAGDATGAPDPPPAADSAGDGLPDKELPDKTLGRM